MTSNAQTALLVATTPVPAKKEAAEIVRRTSQYHPSVWGEYFLTYTFHQPTMHKWIEEADILKEKVKKMVSMDYNVGRPLVEKLKLIDEIQRLGIAYHFESELQETFNHIYFHYKNYPFDFEEHNLFTISLLFRLLRDHGFNISCDVFNKLKDDRGRFKEELLSDVEGLLSLYEATQLRVNGESILDDALVYVETKLQSMVSDLDDSTAKQVLYALRTPIRKSLTRLSSRDYISFYQNTKSHNQILLKFAKLDFSLLQIQHRQELSIVSKWWKDLEVKKNFPFARDRLAECYFWILGVFHEPYYAMARKFTTKVIYLTSIIDDIYDNYGLQSELVSFTNAVQRWEISALDKLPDYMKPCYKALLDVYDEMEKEMEKEGKAYAVSFAKEAMKRHVKGYFDEYMWLESGKTPTMEEYMKIALVTIGYQMLATTSLVGMGDVATKETFNWLLNDPQIVNASSVIARIMDDVASNKLEQERGHIPSAVQCYMKQYGVSEEESCVYLNKLVESGWKDLNQAFLEPTNGISMSVLTRILNLARAADLVYKGKDNYTNPKTNFKQHIACVLVDSLET